MKSKKKEEIKRISILIPKKIHSAIKLESLKSDTSIQKMLCRLLEASYSKKKEKKND